SARCEPLSILDDHSRFLVGLFPTRTSNRDVSEWGSVFPDPVPAGAAIDRLFDRATVVPFKGPSYRIKGKIVAPMSAEIQTFNNLE
ncbi:MAG: hypothetical protein RL326_2032, partial [Pseudomonadota bacterium]